VIVHDPIRDALRQLVREKRIDGWQQITRDRWVVAGPGWTAQYTTDEVNDLIAMFWKEAA
jgi:hypothetical protein